MVEIDSVRLSRIEARLAILMKDIDKFLGENVVLVKGGRDANCCGQDEEVVSDTWVQPGGDDDPLSAWF